MVQLFNGTTVQWYTCSMVQLFNGRAAQWCNCSTVKLSNSSNVQLFNCQTVYLFVYLSSWLPVCLTVRFSVCLSVRLIVRPSVCLSDKMAAASGLISAVKSFKNNTSLFKFSPSDCSDHLHRRPSGQEHHRRQRPQHEEPLLRHLSRRQRQVLLRHDAKKENPDQIQSC